MKRSPLAGNALAAFRYLVMAPCRLAVGIAGTMLVAQQPDRSAPRRRRRRRRSSSWSGPKDHGDAGRHEYEKDLRGSSRRRSTLRPTSSGVTTAVYVGEAPRDPAVYADAAGSSSRAAPIATPAKRIRCSRRNRTRRTGPTTRRARLSEDARRPHEGRHGHDGACTTRTGPSTGWPAATISIGPGGLWVSSGSKNPVDQWR